jgi:hypothetical protein
VIYSVQNPENQGGTGNFRLKTFENENLIDSNSRFGVAGIAQKVGNFISAGVNLVQDDDLTAGASARFEFKFKLNRDLLAWSWIRFTFPDDGFSFAEKPTCTGFKVEGFVLKGDLECYSEGNRVTLVGFNEDVPAFSHVGVRVTAGNPPFSVKTGSFAVETGKNLTNTVYDEMFGIPGITVKPGMITHVLMESCNQTVLSQGKEVIYRLSFLISNPVEQGGLIKILATQSFEFSGFFLVEMGLMDVSDTDIVNFSYDSSSYVLTISNFVGLKDEFIVLIFSMINPSTSGPTDPLIIRTFNSNGDLVDENSDSAFVNIESLTSPSTSSISFPSGNSASGSPINLKLSITPQSEIPSSGWIILTLPYGFTTESQSQTCYSKPTHESESSSPSCFYQEGKVHIQLFSDSPGVFGKFETGQVSSIRITSLLSPSKSGNYYFYFDTLNNEGVLIESGTAKGTLTSSSMSVSATVVHAGINTATIFSITADLNKDLHSGSPGKVTTDPVSYFEVEFPTMTGTDELFSVNLGLDSDVVPCRGISGITEKITCFVSTSPASASETTPVVVTISGFEMIHAPASVKIDFAGIFYVKSAQSGNVRVTTYEVSNRIRYDLESGTASFPAGVNMPSKSFYAVTLTLSEKKVQSSTTLSTGTSFTTSTASGNTDAFLILHIFQTHDGGYCENAELRCIVDSVVLDCICYYKADMILITLSSSFVAGSHTMQISGLVTPESVPSSNDDLLLYIIGSGSVKEYSSFSGKIPQLEAGKLSKVKITPSDSRQGTVFVGYSVVFSAEHLIPSGGSIEITFPSDYSLPSSSPEPSCSSGYLHAVSSSVSCSLSSNTLRLSDFQSVPAGNIIVVWVKGVKNPSVSETSQFQIRTQNKNDQIIDENSKSGSILLENEFETINLEFLNIEIFPTNANASAEYVFTFTPSELLGAGSTLKIDFPLKQFGSLPASPTCRLSGEVTTFASCTVSASDLFIITDKDLPYKPLSVSVIGLKNFDEGTSESFGLSSYYDDVLVQSTSSSTISTTVTTTSQAGKLQVSNILFSPKNEAEKSTFEFYFSPVSGVSLSQNIIIKFPEDFDHHLGDNLHCWSEGLQGFLECELLHAWTLIVKKHDSFSPCTSCSIVLYVSGIFNPRQGKTGQFLLGILEGNTFIELNEFAGSVLVEDAPEYLEIIRSLPGSLYAREVQDLSFNVTCNLTIPDTLSGGQIWVDFSEDYVLTDSFLTCASSSFWANGTPKCSTIYSKVVMEGQTNSFQGNLMVVVQGLPNPLFDVLADYVTVEAADTFHNLIIARSYPNLDPSRFQYHYRGPLLSVNTNEKFYVRRGTYSKPIPITLSYPSALNLTLVPKSDPFQFIPSQIPLLLGESKTFFRINIPFNSEDKEYIITWSILGEIDPPFYTPLLKTKFEVTKDDLIPVKTEEIMPIPKGFSSLPVIIQLDQAPSEDLIIHLSLPDTITGVELSSQEITFKSGEFSKNFTLSVNLDVSRMQSKVTLSLSGTNAEAFNLLKSFINFQVQEESLLPEVLGAGVVKTSRTNATFTVSTTIFCWVYYAFALRGTQPPSFKETKSQGPASFVTTETRYGTLRVAGSTTTTFTLTGLKASTRYSLFLWAEDLTGVQSSSYSQIDFDTDQIFKTSQVRLKFTQVYLNDVEILKTSEVIQLESS